MEEQISALPVLSPWQTREETLKILLGLFKNPWNENNSTQQPLTSLLPQLFGM